MINLNIVGAHLSPSNPAQLNLGIYLPNITRNKGYRLFADIIHVMDQFDPAIPAFGVELVNTNEQEGLWTYTGDLSTANGPGNLGSIGKHLYRYRLARNGQVLVKAFSDPFAKDSGVGTFSAFNYRQTASYNWQDTAFTVPEMNELIIYELMVDDFSNDFAGAIEKIIYLKSLGVNCIELMPVTNIPEPYRWGYMPMSYFAIEERYGGREELKKFIDSCHQNGIAVIHDAVYAHAHPEFCYNKVYWAAREENPMIGPFAEDMFGVGSDFNKTFTYEYFKAVNQYFIEELHFDGFRYDYVPGIYDGPTGNGYARIVYDTYQSTKNISRFQSPTHNKIIQIAEHLGLAKEILEVTYTSGSKRWEPMLKAHEMVQQYGTILEEYVREILLIDFQKPWPSIFQNGNDAFPVAPLQFIESHDKSRLMYIQGGPDPKEQAGFDFFNLDRSKWFRMQPFAISLMTCEGIPLLWQGQEFGEVYGKLDQGGSRVLAARPLHWNYFYEESGRTLVNLYRKLGQLRSQHAALRSRQSYYFHQHSNLQNGLVAYLRKSENPADMADLLVVLNFSEQAQVLTLPLQAGRWTELLIGNESMELPQDGNVEIQVPSNFGKIYAQGPLP